MSQYVSTGHLAMAGKEPWEPLSGLLAAKDAGSGANSGGTALHHPQAVLPSYNGYASASVAQAVVGNGVSPGRSNGNFLHPGWHHGIRLPTTGASGWEATVANHRSSASSFVSPTPLAGARSPYSGNHLFTSGLAVPQHSPSSRGLGVAQGISSAFESPLWSSSATSPHHNAMLPHSNHSSGIMDTAPGHSPGGTYLRLTDPYGQHPAPKLTQEIVSAVGLLTARASQRSPDHSPYAHGPVHATPSSLASMEQYLLSKLPRSGSQLSELAQQFYTTKDAAYNSDAHGLEALAAAAAASHPALHSISEHPTSNSVVCVKTELSEDSIVPKSHLPRMVYQEISPPVSSPTGAPLEETAGDPDDGGLQLPGNGISNRQQVSPLMAQPPQISMPPGLQISPPAGSALNGSPKTCRSPPHNGASTSDDEFAEEQTSQFASRTGSNKDLSLERTLDGMSSGGAKQIDSGICDLLRQTVDEKSNAECDSTPCTDRNFQAALRLEAKIANEAAASATSAPSTPSSSGPAAATRVGASQLAPNVRCQSATPQHNQDSLSGSPFRAGHGTSAASLATAMWPSTSAASLSENGSDDARYTSTTTSAGTKVYTCIQCKYSCTSKFHFNSHMNTHSDHKCDFCDYRSRTEGRMKKHMKESHDPVQTSTLLAGDNSSGALLSVDESLASAPTPDDHSISDPISEPSSVEGQWPQDDMMSADGGTPTRDKTPSVPSKPKTYKCKQCVFVSRSKDEFWEHARTHIKKEKQLVCPKCPFVTEYKHHLEYHLRNHYGSKPFRCQKCNYSCVNKSMLNSHMKSHSNYYQYRCADCTYATKYCHSLKLHLRKYNHQPATVVNPDGTTIDANAIDVYGNRRGPRPKKNESISPQRQHPPGLPVAGMPAHQSLLPAGVMLPAALSDPRTLVSMPNSELIPFMEAMQARWRAAELAAATRTSMSRLGAQLPTVSSFGGTSVFADQQRQQAAVEAIAAAQNNSNVFKCSLAHCDYASTSKEDMARHTAKHIIENQELARGMHGLVSPTGSTRSSIDRSFDNDAMEPLPSMVGLPSPRFHNQQRHEVAKKLMQQSTDVGHRAAVSPGCDVSQHCSSPASADKSPASGSASGKSGDETGVEIPTPNNTGSSKRKGRAVKLDKIALKLQRKLSPSPERRNASNDAMDAAVAQGYYESVEPHEGEGTLLNRYHPTESTSSARYFQHQPNELDASMRGIGALAGATRVQSGGAPGQEIDWTTAFVCHHCEMAFKDMVMYSLHMGYHGYQDPFRCNMCGSTCDGRVGLFLHIAKEPHYQMAGFR